MSLIARTSYRLFISLIIKCSGIESVLNHRLGTRVPVNRHLDIPLGKGSDCKGAFDLMGWEKLAPLVL
jgi:hypothetical protein